MNLTLTVTMAMNMVDFVIMTIMMITLVIACLHDLIQRILRVQSGQGGNRQRQFVASVRTRDCS